MKIKFNPNDDLPRMSTKEKGTKNWFNIKRKC